MNGNTSFLRGLGTCIGLASSSMFLQQEKLTFFFCFSLLLFDFAFLPSGSIGFDGTGWCIKSITCNTLYIHCKSLQGFTECPYGFPAISMETGCKNHRETLYSSKGKVAYVVGKPCNIYRLRGNPIVVLGSKSDIIKWGHKLKSEKIGLGGMRGQKTQKSSDIINECSPRTPCMPLPSDVTWSVFS